MWHYFNQGLLCKRQYSYKRKFKLLIYDLSEGYSKAKISS